MGNFGVLSVTLDSDHMSSPPILAWLLVFSYGVGQFELRYHSACGAFCLHQVLDMIFNQRVAHVIWVHILEPSDACNIPVKNWEFVLLDVSVHVF